MSTKRNKSTVTANQTGQIKLQNRYDPLAQHDENQTNMECYEINDSDEEINENDVKAKTLTNKSANKKSPPPIVLHTHPTSHKNFIKAINDNIKNGFEIKYSSQRTNLFVRDHEDYKRYIKKLEEEEIEFHTYTLKNERTHAFVLKGLLAEIEPAEITDELTKKYKINVHQCYKMQTRFNPLYMIVTDNTTSIKQLNQQVRSIAHTRITWDRVINKRKITQCHRCQQWGHATTNCRTITRCLKCAEMHWTKDCKKPYDTEPTCANCNEHHPANSTSCIVYRKRLEIIEKSKQQHNTHTNTHPRWSQPADMQSRQHYPELPYRAYVPAPLPTTNPWERRGQAQTQHTQEHTQPEATQNHPRQTHVKIK